MKFGYGLRFDGLPDFKSPLAFERTSVKEARHLACMAALRMAREFNSTFPYLRERYHGYYVYRID